MRPYLQAFAFWFPVICYGGAEEAPAAAGAGKGATQAAPALVGGATGAEGAVGGGALSGEGALDAGTGAAAAGAGGGGGGGAGTPAAAAPEAAAAPAVLPGAPVSAPAGGAEFSGTGVTPAPAPAPTPVTGATTPATTGLTTGGAGSAPGVPEATDASTGQFAGETAHATPGVPPPASPPSAISKAMDALGITKNGGIGPNALPLGLNLGAAAINAGSNRSLEKKLTAAGQPASSASNQLLQEGTSGTVPPAVMQQFNQTLKDAVAEITQRYANMGRDATTDSAAQAEIQKATEARDAQVANYASGLVTQGLQAAGVAAGPLTQGALAGAQQDKEFAASQANALQQMALLDALSRGQRPQA